MRLARAAVISVGFLVYSTSAVVAQTLAWDANPESDIAGYRVFYGTQSGNYPNQIDVGNQTYYTPPSGFDWTRTLYFAVKAYNTSGLLSSFSAELQWVPPAPPPPTTVTSLVASVSYPLNAGEPVTWTATGSGPSTLEYRFYMYKKTGWTMAQNYGPSNLLTWIPAGSDVGEPYRVQVWARTVGSSADYEAIRTTPNFAVTGQALDLEASVDFPTPPGNPVTWTARAQFSYSGTLEYQFLIANEIDHVFTVFRDYSTSHTAQWIAPAIGRYAVKVFARPVGGAAAEYTGTTPFFDVSQSPLSLTQLTADVVSPAYTGTKVTWTARAKGGSSGPLQYQFWIYSAAKGWTLGQPYGSSHSFTWTPTWGDEGDHNVQVWVRNNGSTATYEALRSSGWLKVQRAAMTLTTATLFPVPPGSHVDWTAAVPDPSADLEYQFWIYSVETASWTLGRAYDPGPMFRWIPPAVGDYALQVWARQRGSVEQYEVLRSTNFLRVTQEPAQVVSLTSDVPLPATPGTTITWTAGAIGGTAGPLQYRFWRRSNGVWILAQEYSSVNSYTWTPTAADVGEHALQVWVRSAGSSAMYESLRSTGFFWIQ
jgi:hypothetical protein